MPENDLARYGGFITNIDFNFQAGASVSTASVEVVSEDGKYIEPRLGSRFVMPFGLDFQMVVMGFTTRKNNNSAVLSIELADKSVEFLDNKLVLVRGEHTTGTRESDTDLTVDEAVIFPLLEMPEDAWPEYAKNIAQSSSPEFFTRANREPALLQSTSNVWVLGGGRSIYTPTNQIIFPVIDDETNNIRYKVFRPEDDEEFYLVYEKGEFKSDISETGQDEVLSKENIIRYNASDVKIKFGYTAKEFKDLMIRNGIRILDANQYLSNNTILFNTAGTFREVLSSIAQKLGFFFYYDFARKLNTLSNPVLVILGNEKINEINTSIRAITTNSDDTAVTLSYSKTLQGVESNHIVVKGEINEEQGTREGGYSGLDNVGRSLKFKRIPVEDFFQQESNFIRKQALDDFYALFISSAENEQQLFNDFVLAYYMDGNTIGDLFNENHCKKTDAVKYNIEPSAPDPTQETTDEEGNTPDEEEEGGGDAVEFRNIPKGKRIQYPLLRVSKEDGDGNKSTTKQTQIIPPSESGLYEFLQLFYDLVFNLYISPSVPSYKAGQIAFSEGKLSIDPLPYNGNVKLKDVDAISDFVQLIENHTPFQDKIKDKTIADLAKLAGHGNVNPSSTAVGERMFFVARRNEDSKLGIRSKENNEQDEEISKKVDRLISATVASHETDGQAKLICANAQFGQTMIEPIVKLSELMFKQFKDDRKEAIRARYQRVNDEDKEFEFEFDEDSIVKPNKYSIKHVPDSLRRSKPLDGIEKSSLVYLQGPKKDMDLFFDNVTGGPLSRRLVPFIKGPLRSAEIQYFRAPISDDIDPQKGVSSFQISVGAEGISTTIRYSTRKLFPLDEEVLITEDRVARNIGTVSRTLTARQKNVLGL